MHPNLRFNARFKPEWLEDDMVKRMILDVDKSEVISPYCVVSPILGQIPNTSISGGVKALILMLKTDYIVNASSCGDNCVKWIIEISKIKDITIRLGHCMKFPTEQNVWDSIDAYCINSGKRINSYSDYVDEVLEWV